MESATRLEELLSHWQKQHEDGNTPTPEELCANDPELLTQFKEKIEALSSQEKSMVSTKDFVSAPNQPTNDPDATGNYQPKSDLEVPETVGHYEIRGEIARGGMGVVLRAFDPDFERTLALKVTLDKHQGHEQAEKRFVEEAKITGQLQHPGIPPVHELGHLPDGRPFFAMKLIEGQTLSEMFQARKSPADNLPHFLGVFEQICQTIAYAHSQNVIHRDLKPLNIMVGAFGEVQVMDWGLAKKLGTTRSNDTALSDSINTADSNPAMTTDWQKVVGTDEDSRTRAGAILGTVTHMAPEQARGEIAEIDKASDVFGLGAILCQILTGEPPFGGKTVADILGKAQQGDWQSSREKLEQSGVDAELVAFTKKCLAKEKLQRFANASELAQAMAGYQEGVQEKLKQIELERATAQANAASERKRRRTQLTAVGVVFALLILGALIVYVVKIQSDAAMLAQERNLQGESLVKQILAADTRDVPPLVTKLEAYRDIANPLLLAEYENDQATSRQKLHVSLALLPVDSSQVDYLYNRLLDAQPQEVPVIVDVLMPHKDQLLDKLWSVAERPAKGKASQRLRAAAALTNYDPENAKWSKINTPVVDDLVSENPIFLSYWTEAFRPIKGQLLSPLAAIFRDRESERIAERKTATNLLADYASGNPPVLANLLMDANDTQFAVVYPLLEEKSEQAIPILTAEIDKQPPVGQDKVIFERKGVVATSDPKVKGKLPAKRHEVSLLAGKLYQISLKSSEFDTYLVLQDKTGRELTYDDDGGVGLNAMLGYTPTSDATYSILAASYQGTGAFQLKVVEIANNHHAKEQLVKRQANAAVALLKMNQPERVWPLLKHCPDPRLRSYLIHKFGPLETDVKMLVKRLEEEPDITIQRALILGLGPEEFGEEDWDVEEKQKLVTRLKDIYRQEADPGLHGAAEWLLRQWNEDSWLKQVNAEWAKNRDLRDQKLKDLGKQLAKGSPHIQRQWYVNSQGQTMVVIPGPVEFLMGSPLTEKDRRDSEVQHNKTIDRTFAIAAKAVTIAEYRKFNPGHTFTEKYAPEPNCPVASTNWYQAASYCNWLSQQEGIPEDQWCYVTDAMGQVNQLRENYLSLTGYRLPTEAEAEYAVRAETTTCRYFGETEELLGKYAWYEANSKGRRWPVGLKKPNDFGLFDMQGNAYNWCQESYKPYTPGADEEDGIVIIGKRSRVLRGGSFALQASFMRSALRVNFVPPFRNYSFGFRPARTLPHNSLTPLAPALEKKQDSKAKKANPQAQTLEGTLTKDDPLDTFPKTKKSYASVNEIEFKQGEIYRIDLNAKFDPYLRIETANKVALLDNDDASPPATLDSRLIFTPKEDGKYRLIATSYKPGETGDYQITISSMQKIPLSKTFKGTLVKSPQTIQGKFVKLHKVELEKSMAYTIHLVSQKFDTFLILLDDRTKRPVAQNDDIAPGNTKESRIDFTPSRTGSYTVVVTSFTPGETGDHELTVQGYELRKE